MSSHSRRHSSSRAAPRTTATPTSHPRGAAGWLSRRAACRLSPPPPSRIRIPAMTAQKIVPLRLQPQASPRTTQVERLLCWSESWQDEPGIHLPDLPPDLSETLPDTIASARLDLASGDPGEVMAALTTLAGRRGF